MKLILHYKLILLFLLINFALEAQTNELYVRFKHSSHINKQPKNAKEDVLPFVPALKPIIAKYQLKHLRNSFHFSKFEKFKRTYRLKFDNTAKAAELLSTLKLMPEVEFAEFIIYDKPHWVANDMGNATANGQYALHLMNAERAWDITRGLPTVVVAVVDDAVDLNHPDLANKLTGGYDLADDDNDPNIPNIGFRHGTHVAGIIGARTNNGIGVASIGNRVLIMPVKVRPDDGDDDTFTHGYEGILWAAENGADIINCSWGNYSTLASNQDVINEATAMGALVVASAGNDNTTLKVYPAAFNNVLAVASTDINDEKSSFSNHGSWIDISAPGTNILSTVPDLPNDGYEYFNGTSMAAPMVSGVCALIKSLSNLYTPASITQIVKNTADPIIYANDPDYNGLLGTGRVDAYAALASASVCVSQKTITGSNFTTALTESGDWIQSSNTTIIPANEQVILDAAEYITLKPGFHAVSGSVFRADIEGCGDGPPDGITQMHSTLPRHEAILLNRTYAVRTIKK